MQPRDSTREDAIAGAVPRFVFEPSSARDCTDVFQAARADRLALAVVGGRTELGLGGRPSRLDAVVSTTRHDRVVEYAPSDQLVVVEAGMTLSALQSVLAREGQRLACDPPLAARATIGGLLATNAFGPLRTRHGTLRDLLIGVSVVRADGTVARGGGKVVKNVAGFDLPKLMVGALGTLGMIASATFRLHPLPESAVTLVARTLQAAAVRDLVVAMRDAQIEPAAVVAVGRLAAFDALVRFEGFAAGVAEQCERTASILRTQGYSTEVLRAGDANAVWLEHDVLRTRGNTRIKVAALPSSFGHVANELAPRLAGALSKGATILYPSLGVGFVTGDAEDGAALASAIAAARAGSGSHPPGVVVHALPVEMRNAVDVWGPEPASFALMRRVKARFDPDHRMNPGRFVGGL